MKPPKSAAGRAIGALCAALRHLFSKLLTPDYGRYAPAKVVTLGYLSYMTLGWLLLCLPISQQTGRIKALDNLFTAVSAVSTTGLTTISVADSYTYFGQLIVLVLIQLGGLGYMTVGSFVVLSRNADLSMARAGVLQTVFSLPASFELRTFIRGVMLFTVAIELAGTGALYLIFAKAGIADPLWPAVFHSVSAFCTAGFSLFNTSFEAYAADFWLNAVIGTLSYLGAVGFIVCLDYWRSWRDPNYSLTLTSRIIVRTTLWLSLIGTLMLFVADPALAQLSPSVRLLAAFFQSMTAMTTVGFDTVSIATLSKASLLLIVVLMIIGASPSGTGGGIKTTTFSAIFGVMRSAIYGEKEVRFWGRAVPLARVWVAVASLGFYISALVIGTYLLEMTERSGFIENLFEAASALGTVGLSMGITSALSTLGKLIIILLMFCGRLGPLTFGMALFSSRPQQRQPPDNDLAI